MRTEGTFSVHDFTAAPVTPAADIHTGVDVGVATMEKRYSGGVSGRSATLFTAAFNQASGTGTYLAMESFEGTLNDASGTFNFAHVASTVSNPPATHPSGQDRLDESFVIVPASGTGELSGISGSGGISITPDGAHHIWFDYTHD